jgi:antitoxin (DNA-binding transcriptional repressor) of toxin-antitoxin stability system
MREVALIDATKSLSALIQEIVDTGAEILITRQGKPAAKLSPVGAPLPQAERDAILNQIIANRDARARANPVEAVSTTWEELKAWMDDDR